jgi:para-aminobenzoate synthetase / 4-amino-4-deoxychorismate lyase
MSRWTPLPEYLRTLAAENPSAVLLETSRFDEENRHSYLFLDPVETFAARTPEDLPLLFVWIEEARRHGLHLAGYLSYECGYSFGYKSKHLSAGVHPDDALLLAWFGAYSEPFIFDHAAGAFLGRIPHKAPSPKAPIAFTTDAPLHISESDYAQKIDAIHRYIEAGDTYQVNFTDSVTVTAHHPPADSFTVLAQVQPVAYSALLHVEGHHILSHSPELFFRIRNGRITTRPMKGTMPRGLDVIEDALQSAKLHADIKNRAEHIMIVDLLRNDLGRICRMGSVQVEDLFAVECYRTLLQMTSTISGELRPGLTFHEIFHALFPSGSITGAPKLRTMEIIRELESRPRGIYTGAIGHITPSGDATFNVAIRTLVLNSGIAHMGVGGGIVADSDAASEYRECQLKASFLTRPYHPFQIIETMLFDGATIPHLALHLNRLESSAAYFDFDYDRIRIESAVAEFTAKLIPGQRSRVRLLLSADGEITLSHSALTDEAGPLRIRISPHRISSSDVLRRHKTTHRDLYDRELAQARQQGFDEVLFLNERDGLAEGAISNLFIQIEGRLVTPPLSAGVLPGILRQRILVENPNAEERILTLEDLRHADAVYLGNSVRGLRLVESIESSEEPRITIYTDSSHPR